MSPSETKAHIILNRLIERKELKNLAKLII